jgi:hypothetical protein
MSDYEYYNNLTDQELLDLVSEHYYSIGVTGVQAMEGLFADIVAGDWSQKHGVPDSRMKRIAVLFTDELNERGAWHTVAGQVTKADRKRKQGVSRLGRLMRTKKR